MDEKKFVFLLNQNNDKLLNVLDTKIQENNEKLLNVLDTKIQENNEKLLNVIDTKLDTKIQENNEKLLNVIDSKIETKIESKLSIIEQKMMDGFFYFEENYGKKIDIIFEKIQLDNEMNEIKYKEFEKNINHNESTLMSHEIRITNLEKSLNSK